MVVAQGLVQQHCTEDLYSPRKQVPLLQAPDLAQEPLDMQLGAQLLVARNGWAENSSVGNLASNDLVSCKYGIEGVVHHDPSGSCHLDCQILMAFLSWRSFDFFWQTSSFEIRLQAPWCGNFCGYAVPCA